MEDEQRLLVLWRSIICARAVCPVPPWLGRAALNWLASRAGLCVGRWFGREKSISVTWWFQRNSVPETSNWRRWREQVSVWWMESSLGSLSQLCRDTGNHVTGPVQGRGGSWASIHWVLSCQGEVLTMTVSNSWVSDFLMLKAASIRWMSVLHESSWTEFYLAGWKSP